ncbi:T9SS type A sorting domain-containing protein [Tannerella forsythia]|uniref:T9SS C-terminal target domain-containing protein n=1 Tax=Tannerella forsythia TaxID=28112 RepID=A0A3P1XKN8_TANFO|nr:T9SS type A sorting domain-containing protein [Tannerella forsythia]RRD59329.1 T9SS C-terminal target domain-containing protein [Tannerella forsythia]
MMKRIKRLSITICLLYLAPSLFAQTIHGFGESPESPGHPLNPKLGQPRILADTIRIKEHGGITNPPYPPTLSIKKFNKNLLIDTVYTFSPMGMITSYISKYSDKGRLLSLSSYYPGHKDPVTGAFITEPKENLVDEYEYGQDGRLLKHKTYKLDGGSTSLDKIFTYTYVMTDSGYISNDSIEYILDKKGRLAKLKFLKAKNEYVVDSASNRYRVGDFYYSYFDGGYTLRSYHRGNTIWGTTDTWVKTDYFFQKKGYLSKTITYQRKKGEPKWKKLKHDEYAYSYRAGNPHSNLVIQKPGKVYAAEGAVVIENEQPALVAIYTFGGQLVEQRSMAAGIDRIPLPKGLYIVVVGRQGHKIVVR